MTDAAPETSALNRRLLHVGCGQKRLADLPDYFQNDWDEVRLDVNEAHAPDIVAAMPGLSPVESASCDAIWSSHNIEHLFDHEAQAAAREFRRVLRESGFLIISTPDLRAGCKAAATKGLDAVLYTSPAGPITPRDTIYGHQRSIRGGDPFMAHRNGFDLETLRDLLQGAGFARVYGERRGWQLIFIAAKAPITTAEAAAGLHAIIGPKET